MKLPVSPSLFQLIFGVVAFPLAWLFPGTLVSALLTFPALYGLLALFHDSARPYRRALAAGVVIYVLGFYWLCLTISHFGGFPLPIAFLIFLLFCATAAIQFVLAVFVFRSLPAALDRAALRGTAALLITQAFFPRIFPWEFGHTLLPLKPLVQSADLLGTTIIALSALWLVEAVQAVVALRRAPLLLVAPVLLLGAQLGYGLWITDQVADAPVTPVKVALVQANISVEEKHDKRLVVANVQRYKELTSTIPADDELVIWPETVIHQPFYASLGHISRDGRGVLPRLEGVHTLLTGALTASSPTQFHNSAVVIWPDGTIPPPAHKRYLMPFGEYVPLGDTIPFIRTLSGGILDLTPGEGDPVLPIALPREPENPFLVGPLICYEDVIPSLARRATRAGAELLINLTNDAWFGNTVAPYQHHLIASFRAIENRRTLIRSTNTGLTAVVSPLGETLRTIPPFSDGTLSVTVNRMKYSSLYSRLDIESIWQLVWLVLGALVAFKAFRDVRGRASARRSGGA